MDINLIDWRTRRQLVANYRFYLLIGVGMVSVVVLALGYVLALHLIARHSEQKIGSVECELLGLSAKVTEVTEIQQQIANLQRTLTSVSDVHSANALLVQIWSALPQVLPKDLFLTGMDRVDATLHMSGTAADHDRVTALLDNMRNLGWGANAKLTNVVAVADGVEFNLEVLLDANVSNA